MARAKRDKSQGDHLVTRNRRAYFDYDVGDAWEAGLVLIGSEVRALRIGNAELTDAWIDVRDGVALIKGMRIPPLPHAAFGHEEKRPRKLLLHSGEIEALRAGIERDGMTAIATKCYFKNNRAKVEVALGRGKKKHDKRATERAKQADKEARLAMRRR